MVKTDFILRSLKNFLKEVGRMEFICSTKSFAQAVKKVSSIADTSTYPQISSHMLLKTEADKIMLSATDNKKAITLYVSPKKKSKDGGITLPAWKFRDIIFKLESPDMNL